MGAALMVSGAGNYAFSTLLAHGLGPVGYGMIGAWLKVWQWLFIPVGVIPWLAIRSGSQLPEATIWLAGLGVGGLGAAWMAAVPSLDLSVLGAVLLGASVAPGMAAAVYVGQLERQRRYRAVAWVAAVGAVWSLVVACAVTASGHPRLSLAGGVLAGQGLGYGVARRLAAPSAPLGQAEAGDARQAVGAVLASLVLTLGQTLDGVWARLTLPAAEAGQYGGMATVAHSLPYVAGGVATVLLSAALSGPARSSPRQGLPWLGRALGAYGVLAGAGLVILRGYGAALVNAVLGGAFAPATGWVGSYGVAMAALGWVAIWLGWAVARGQLAVVAVALTGTVAWGWALAGAHDYRSMVTAGVRVWLATAVAVTGAGVGLECTAERGRVR